MKFFSSVVAAFSRKDFYKYVKICSALFLIGVFVVAGFYYINFTKKNEEANTFFSTALREYKINEHVIVRTREYTVKNGRVSARQGEVSQRDELSALKLAYAKTIAKRNPRFALAGSDLKRLDESIHRLDDLRFQLAELQNTKTLSLAVERGLFPLEFLRAALRAEKARRLFITSGTDENAQHYEDALFEVASTYKKNAIRFVNAFQQSVPFESPRYGTTQKIVSREGTLQAADALLERIQDTRKELIEHKSCLRGEIASCDVNMLELPKINILDPLILNEDDVALSEQARSFYREIGLTTDSKPTIAISESVCVDKEKTLPLFTFWSEEDTRVGIAIIGNIRFIKITGDTNIPFVDFFNEINVNHVSGKELNHYNCLEVDKDVGRIFATLAIANYAKNTPLSKHVDTDASRVFESLESRLTSRIVQEADSSLYLSEALALAKAHILPKSIEDEVVDLALQLNNRSARFEWITDNLSFIESRNIFIITENNIATDLTAPYLFYARSGFASLNMGGNASFGPHEELFDAKEGTHESEPYVYLSSILESEDELKKAIEDMKIYLRVHTDAL